MNLKRIKNIIEALAKSEDIESINILEEIGTNCSLDEVRMMTSRALIQKNNPRALEIIISKKGKGINDLSSQVAMSSINELLALKDKTEAMKLLEQTTLNHEDSDVKEIARSTKALMAFSS